MICCPILCNSHYALPNHLSLPANILRISLLIICFLGLIAFLGNFILHGLCCQLIKNLLICTSYVFALYLLNSPPLCTIKSKFILFILLFYEYSICVGQRFLSSFGSHVIFTDRPKFNESVTLCIKPLLWRPAYNQTNSIVIIFYSSFLMHISFTTWHNFFYQLATSSFRRV